MMKQFLEVKQNYPGVLLLYRMGDFYETFFEDAIITSQALEITLTSRESGALGRVPMAGVPAKAVDGYLQRLLEKQFKVAICDQTEDPAAAKGLVQRQVTRVLSSGTVSDERFLKSKEHHYLAALVQLKTSGPHQQWGLAYCDVSTGGFWATELDEVTWQSELSRVNPAEVLVVGEKRRGLFTDEWVPLVPQQLHEHFSFTPVPPTEFDPKKAVRRIEQWFSIADIASYGLHEGHAALGAIGALLHYLDVTHPDVSQRPVFDGITPYSIAEIMQLSPHTRRHLELTQTVKDGRKEGSLLSVLDKTATAMGGRLLRDWLQAPLLNADRIAERHDSVAYVLAQPEWADVLRETLPQIYDMERLSTKVQMVTAQPKDLVALAQSCQLLAGVAPHIPANAPALMAQLGTLPSEFHTFTTTVLASLNPSPPMGLKEGGLFATGYHPDIDRMREVLDTQESWLTAYEAAERERTGIKTLKLGYNGAFGFFIEISKALSSQAPAEYQRRQTLTNAERYITPELKAQEDKVFEARTQLFDLEYQLFIQFRQSLQPLGALLKSVAHQVATVDVLQSLAQVAKTNRYVRPEMVQDSVLRITQGRHPVVESMLFAGEYVANDCVLKTQAVTSTTDEAVANAPQLMVITGPNMAGKSTYMRQLALMVVMAQMGSFVPAQHAVVGLVDQIFSRIGAVDDLSAGQSTFMVEMIETAHILHGATSRSLVILDEVGRGTSTYDGVSIAWSVAEYLATHNQCRTLFATHYHELNTLPQLHPGVIQNYRVLVSEQDGHIEFLHQVAPGAAQKSYGIQVARMAGVPQGVIKKAEALLSRMHEKELTVIDQKRQKSLLQAAKDDQLKLFAPAATKQTPEPAQP